MMKQAQRLGAALMQAVAVMPLAALFMGIGYYIDPTGWGSNSLVAKILITAGAAVLDNLGVIFAIAVAFGLSKDKAGASAFAGWLGYKVVTSLLQAPIIAMVQGVKVEEISAVATKTGWSAMNNKNVFVGILVGILAAWVYNRFHETQLPTALAFFSGRRLVPILTGVLSIALACVLYFVWPFVYGGLFHFGTSIVKMGAVGAGIYGFLNRLLIPFGLHHALNAIFWFDTIGINDIGLFWQGQAAIDAGTATAGVTGMYQAGFFPIMMFGLPGAALAMFLTAKPSKKKIVGSLMLTGALTTFLTGVTEPLEFSFMFVAPLLYVVHSLFTGLSLFICATFKTIAGFGFSAGLIDMFLSVRNPLAVNWYFLILIGLVFFVVYLLVFTLLIKTLNLKTPGREDDEEEVEVELKTTNHSEVAKTVLEGVGGKDNVTSVDYCTTRLRLEIKDYLLVDEKKIKTTGAQVIRPSQKAVQVIIGPQVEFVANEFKKLVE